LVAGNTYIEFQRTSGNADSVIRKAYITDSTKLTSGAHSAVININTSATSNDVLLICGTTYQVRII